MKTTQCLQFFSRSQKAFLLFLAVLVFTAAPLGWGKDLAGLRLETIDSVPGMERKPILTEIPGKPGPGSLEEPRPPAEKPLLKATDEKELQLLHVERYGKRAGKLDWLKVTVAYPFFGFIRDVIDLPFNMIDYMNFLSVYPFAKMREIDKKLDTIGKAKSGGYLSAEQNQEYDGLMNERQGWDLATLPALPVVVSTTVVNVLALSHLDMLLCRLGNDENNYSYNYFFGKKEYNEADSPPFPNARKWRFHKDDADKLAVFRRKVNAEIQNENATRRKEYEAAVKEFSGRKQEREAYKQELARLNADNSRFNEGVDRALSSINDPISRYNEALKKDASVALAQLKQLAEAASTYGDALPLNAIIRQRREELDSAIAEENARQTADLLVQKEENDFQAAIKKARESRSGAPLDKFLADYPNTSRRDEAKKIQWSVLPKIKIMGGPTSPASVPVMGEAKLLAEELGKAKVGNIYLYKGEEGQFYKILYDNERIGYVRKSLCKKEE